MRRTAVVLALAGIMLTGCASHAEASPTHATKVAPSPTATASATAFAIVLPTDCTKVVAPDVYAKELAPTPLNDPAFIAADASGMRLTEAHVDVDTATSFLSRAKLLHWNCADTHGGRECQKAEQSGTHPVATLRTVFLRDDVFIDVTQSNFITNDIVGSIVATLWK